MIPLLFLILNATSKYNREIPVGFSEAGSILTNSSG